MCPPSAKGPQTSVKRKGQSTEAPWRHDSIDPHRTRPASHEGNADELAVDGQPQAKKVK